MPLVTVFLTCVTPVTTGFICVEAAMGQESGQLRVCSFCDSPSVRNLDGDELCEEHSKGWLRAEREALRMEYEMSEYPRDEQLNKTHPEERK
jgi:hypothetical protein